MMMTMMTSDDVHDVNISVEKTLTAMTAGDLSPRSASPPATAPTLTDNTTPAVDELTTPRPSSAQEETLPPLPSVPSPVTTTRHSGDSALTSDVTVASRSSPVDDVIEVMSTPTSGENTDISKRQDVFMPESPSTPSHDVIAAVEKPSTSGPETASGSLERNDVIPASSAASVHASSASSSVMVNSPVIQSRGTVDDVITSPTALRSRRLSPDSQSYTSTIIRCSGSSPAVITNSALQLPTATDVDVTVPPPDVSSPCNNSEIKTGPNYVSVIKISSTPGAATSVVSDASKTLQPSQPADGGSPPIKSSMRKFPKGHTKTKSVSFSADSVEGVITDTVVSTTSPPPVDASTPPRPQAGDRARQSAVVHCTIPDDGPHRDIDDADARRPVAAVAAAVATAGGGDIRVTGSMPAHRTMVIVSGGTASIKDSPTHHNAQTHNNGVGRATVGSETTSTLTRQQQQQQQLSPVESPVKLESVTAFEDSAVIQQIFVDSPRGQKSLVLADSVSDTPTPKSTRRPSRESKRNGCKTQ